MVDKIEDAIPKTNEVHVSKLQLNHFMSHPPSCKLKTAMVYNQPGPSAVQQKVGQ